MPDWNTRSSPAAGATLSTQLAALLKLPLVLPSQNLVAPNAGSVDPSIAAGKRNQMVPVAACRRIQITQWARHERAVDKTAFMGGKLGTLNEECSIRIKAAPQCIWGVQRRIPAHSSVVAAHRRHELSWSFRK